MKRINVIIRVAVFTLAVAVVGCASSGTGVRTSTSNGDYDRNTTVEVDNPSIPLDDYLRRLPGVQVYGSGPSARIKLNGVSSLILTTDPLFVIDGVRVGRSFSNVYSLLSPTMVQSIQVLKRADASYYGVEGANGVIVIRTKDGG